MIDPYDTPDPFTDGDRWEQPRDLQDIQPQDIQPATTKPIDEPMYPRRSLADRRRDVIKLLTEQPAISNRRVAYIAGVSRELVNGIRNNMIRISKIESCHALRRIGKDGKTYRVSPKPRTREAQP